MVRDVSSSKKKKNFISSICEKTENNIPLKWRCEFRGFDETNDKEHILV